MMPAGRAALFVSLRYALQTLPKKSNQLPAVQQDEDNNKGATQ